MTPSQQPPFDFDTSRKAAGAVDPDFVEEHQI